MNRAKVGITPHQLAALAGYPDAEVLHAYVEDDPQIIWVVMTDDEFPPPHENYSDFHPATLPAAVVAARPIPTPPQAADEQPTWS